MGNNLNNLYCIVGHLKHIPNLTASILIILIGSTITQFDFFYLEGIFFDFFTNISPKQSFNTNIKIIAYDDLSYDNFPDGLKIPAKELGNTIKKLTKLDPKLIAIISTGAQSYSKNELKELELLANEKTPIFWGYLEENLMSSPFNPAIHYHPGFLSKDIFNFGKDEIVRRVLISIKETPTIYTKIAKYLGVETFKNKYFKEGVSPTEFVFIRWKNFKPIRLYSMLDILNDNFEEKEFKNKIILIGRKLSNQKSDYVFTPYSRQMLETPLIEAAAISLDTLLNNTGFIRPPSYLNLLTTTLIGLLIINLSLILPYSIGFIVTLSVFLFILLITYILHFCGIWLLITPILLIVIIGRIFSLPFQIIEQNQKRWQFQRENELLTQIEKIKSNFLSLMSHDFKTPLAKIQTSAETILLNPNCTNESIRRVLLNIIDNTSHLTQYIEKALDLSKAENSAIPLVKTTKDINLIIEEICKVCDELAKEKAILFLKDLSPIFSFKFDVQLIKKVLYNILENSIKYSSPGGAITIKSFEEKEFAVISIADTGQGIPEDEKDFIFDKFYRGKNTNSKGTGLGLYLAKYFIELHNGKITVESELGKGSKFTILLPLTERIYYGKTPNSYC